NRFGHPHPAIEARYRERNISLYRTDWDGAITLKFTASASVQPQIESYRANHRRYWTNVPRREDSGKIKE
ncbi:MAG: hypothetical protein HC782_02590, partial [Gammaproteobacteria bacterium]|nr:hypothetical protein [Gammaproteobacteria bacterium]